MEIRTKTLIAIGALSFVMIAFLVSAKSYFNNKEISLANDRCYEIGGMPKVESDLLTLNYSFSCQENN